MDEELLNIELPKWPFMQVKGEKITVKQAGEILIWTNGGWNDFLTEKLHLDLESMMSYSCISNRRFPHHQMWGWCDWDGNIHANSYNIGKHPSVEEVFGEWSKIAAKFPFLTLTCQLYPAEGCEIIDDPSLMTPLIEFRVSNGEVTVHRPGKPLFAAPEPNSMNDDYKIYGTSPEIPWDLWAPAISALGFQGLIMEKTLGEIIQEIGSRNRHRQHWTLSKGAKHFDNEMSVIQDYAMAKGWISQPPKRVTCWAIRKAAKELNSFLSR